MLFLGSPCRSRKASLVPDDTLEPNPMPDRKINKSPRNSAKKPSIKITKGASLGGSNNWGIAIERENYGGKHIVRRQSSLMESVMRFVCNSLFYI